MPGNYLIKEFSLSERKCFSSGRQCGQNAEKNGGVLSAFGTLKKFTEHHQDFQIPFQCPFSGISRIKGNSDKLWGSEEVHLSGGLSLLASDSFICSHFTTVFHFSLLSSFMVMHHGLVPARSKSKCETK